MRRPGRLKGFTLIELILALAICLALFSIVVPPFYRQFTEHRQLDLATQQAFESILTARRNAVRDSVPVVFEFEIGTGLHRLLAIDGSSKSYTLNLPGNANFQAAKLRDRFDSNSDQKRRLIFREDGSSEGAEFRIQCAGGSRTIRVDRSLGIPQIVREG